MSDIGSFSGMVDGTSEPHPPELVTGKLISFRFIIGALRRRRRLWVGLAVFGLLVGASYHVVKHPTYSATAIVYLAHPPGSNDEVIAGNDLALVKTVDVGERAVALLHEPGLFPLGFLSAVSAREPSDNILALTTSAPTPGGAVSRVDALVKAYLAFRSAQYNLQNQAIVSATNKEIDQLQTQVNHLTNEINASPASQTQRLTNSIVQRSTLESQITNLQQTVQTDDLATISISQGSRVVSEGTLVPSSRAKEVVIDGMSGLVGGLSIGLIVVVLQAVMSDRLWRRQDIADVLGAPVELSIARARRWPRRRTSIARQVNHPRPALQSLVHYLRDRLTTVGSGRVGMVVAIDDPRPAAVAAVVLASRLRSSGKEVVVVDATFERVLGKAFGVAKPDAGQVRVGRGPEINLVAPPKPWETDDDGNWWERVQGEWAHADTVLIVTTIDPAYGARYLGRWAAKAVVTVTAGRSTAQRINVVAELLEAAGVSVSSAVLLGAESSDESIGLSDPSVPRSIRSPEIPSSARGGLPVRAPR